MRGLGVLGVVIVHSGQQIAMAGHWVPWVQAAGGGVQLFYVASAYTLFLSLNARKTESQPNQNFYLRRFFRIAPAFYLAMLLTLLVNWLHPGIIQPSAPLKDYILGFLFLHGFKFSAINSVTGGAWSIAAECMFYALIIPLHSVLRTMKATLWAYGVSTVLLGILCYVLKLHFRSYAAILEVFWFPIEFPVFLLGIALYQLWAGPLKRGAQKVPRASLASAALLVFAVIALYLQREATLVFTHGIAAAAVLLALMLRPWRFLVNRFTRFIGKISYSVYLFHFFFCGIVDRITVHASRHPDMWYGHLYGTWQGFALTVLAIFGLSVPFCTLTWMYIEEPFIRLGRRIIAKREHWSKTRAASLVPPPYELLNSANTPDNQF